MRCCASRWAVVGLAALYIGLHDFAGLAFDVATATRTGTALALSIGVGLVFLAVFAVQVAIAADPRGAIAQRLHHWFYAGFYLDEIFTRLTFRMWPAQLRRASEPTNLAAAQVAAGDAR